MLTCLGIPPYTACLGELLLENALRQCHRGPLKFLGVITITHLFPPRPAPNASSVWCLVLGKE